MERKINSALIFFGLAVFFGELQAENEKQYNSIYLQTLAVDNDEFTSTQLTTLFDIASQCPQDGGIAVHKARALYASADAEESFSDEGCESSEDNLRKGSFAEVEREIILSPNPARESLTIKFAPHDDSTADVIIVNTFGNRLIKSLKSTKQSMLNIDVSDLKSGIYFVQIWKGEKLVGAKKFSIIK